MKETFSSFRTLCERLNYVFFAIIIIKSFLPIILIKRKLLKDHVIQSSVAS